MTQIIRDRTVVEDDWTVVRESEDGVLPDGKIVVPLAWWQANRSALLASRGRDALGVWLAPDSEPADIAADLDSIALVAVDFPKFADGRGYSIARLLRERYGYRGELRAIGDVLRDQLFYLKRCGFDAFAVRADKDIHDALHAFGELTLEYQAAVDEPLPLFRGLRAA
ncbi:DUF934 domain-containing protein [Paraburkholderia sp. J12]|uniref:DUF934 domain-containing protein n=1 Tax=Paraburkholderia sp. J12 TaxID=2805432 RepID=UPI002ABE2DC0|nr:DUF934 domain-containing protein [Paraburkholderia sp. J12]